jgi:hypothetical protein
MEMFSSSVVGKSSTFTPRLANTVQAKKEEKQRETEK